MADHLNHIEDGIANAVSKSGDTINGSLDIDGVLSVGENIKLHSDGEGGNIVLRPNVADNTENMKYWTMDTNSGVLRIFGEKDDGQYVFPFTLYRDGSIGFGNAEMTRKHLDAAPAGGNTKWKFGNIGGSADGSMDYHATMQFIDLGVNQYKVHAWGLIGQNTASSNTNYQYGVEKAKLLAVINELYSKSYKSLVRPYPPIAQLYKSDGALETVGIGRGYTLQGTSYQAIARFHTNEGAVGSWDQNLIFSRCGGHGYLEFEAIVQCS